MVSGMIDQLPESVIIMMDCKTHNTLWVNLNSDRRGRLLVIIITQKGLNQMNNRSATHSSGTAIDLTLVSPILMSDTSWDVLPSPSSMTIFLY